MHRRRRRCAERPTAYVPIGYTFPEGETFKHYALKWVDYHGLHAHLCADADLAERLKEASRRKDWFARYAWSLTDEVWVMWSADPED